MADERSYKGTIAASEILAEIEKGDDAKYDDVVIEGNLEISNLILP